MNIEKCPCGGEVFVFKERKTSWRQLCQIRLNYGREAADQEENRTRFFWAECLDCGFKTQGCLKHSEAVEALRKKEVSDE